MSDVEAQGGAYADDPEFDSLSDHVADEVFDITASNGRLWSLIKAGKLGKAVGLASDVRVSFQRLRDNVEQLEQWPMPQPAQRFTQHKISREFGLAFGEFQRLQKLLAEKERAAIRDAQEGLGDNTGRSDGSSIELEPQSQQQRTQLLDEQLHQDEVSYQQGLIQEREEEIRGIEHGITELNEIFTNLSTVVTEQGSVLDNIESNIYSVAQATRDGSGQLTKAARWQRRSSGRQLCFLIILAIIAFVVILSVLAG